MPSGQNIATSHDLTPKGSVLEGKSPYFRIIQVGEILFHLARCILFKCCNVRFLSGPMVPFNKKNHPMVQGGRGVFFTTCVLFHA